MNGPTLAQRVEQSRAKGGTGLPLSQVTQVVSEVAVALDQVHAQGRVHGDVQASRIAVPARGPAQLLGSSLTNPATVSASDDVRGLVAAAYFALCGVLPSYFRAVSSLGGEAPPQTSPSFPVSPILHRPELPSTACDVLTHGLSSRPEDRPASAGDFAAALRQAVGLAPVSPDPVLSPKRVFAATAALAAAAALALGLWLGHPPRPLPPAVASVPVGPPSWPTPVGGPPQSPLSSAPLPKVSIQGVSHPPSGSRRQEPPIARVKKPPIITASPVPAALADANVASPPLPDTERRIDTFIPVPPQKILPRKRLSPKHLSQKPTQGRAYLRVYARQFVSMSDVINHRLRPVSAFRILVDDNPSQALASGHWALVTPGKHRLAFYPKLGLPFDPNTAFWVRVRAQGRSVFQIPLPRHPGGIQGSAPRKTPPGPV